MTVKNRSSDIPVAESMIRAARQLRKQGNRFHPFEKYIYLWTAFNNIYTFIAYSRSHHVTYKIDDTGNPKTKANGSVVIPKVNRIGEQDQIAFAIAEFDLELENNIIHHPNLTFFRERIPCWRGERIGEFQGHRLNGVINVNFTTDRDYPVWSPIDVIAYNIYVNNLQDDQSRTLLTKQIVDLLYTVRNNLLHGGKIHDDANDTEVVQNATPILATIVGAFYRGRVED